VRFVLLRSWIFRLGRGGAAGTERSTGLTIKPTVLEAPRLAA
jgi:hypothetical protein